MALTIMNNPTAIGAMGKLNSSNAALSKTIGQLSSGLRINSAADDASGLAVSEKLRGQIKGLSKAASNAQDAISLLQTAEASMGSMTDIIQRMRELAVQAGDPAYTTNDRAMLQLEVDQLKSEVNRISTSTEFNTKKLLNGDAAGVWSSDNANVEAILKGSPAEGNYRIDATVVNGTSYGYKSHIMNVKEGFGTVTGLAAGQTTVEGINTRGMLAEAYNFEVTATSAGVAAATSARMGANGTWTGSTAATATSITGADSGYVEITALKNYTGGVTSGSFQISFTNALTGEKFTQVVGTIAGGIMTGAVTLGGVTIAATTVMATGGVIAGDKIAIARQGIVTATTGSGNTDILIGSTAATSLRFATNLSTATATTKSFTTGQWDKDLGRLVTGTMDITFAPSAAAVTAIGATTLTLTNGGVANAGTRLDRLNNFVNADGRNVLENAQNLSIYANGTSFDISVEGSDTVKDLLDKLNGAFETLGLGKDIASFITAPTGAGDETVKGTFVIGANKIFGENSKISFVGDQNVLNGLGVNTIREGTNSTTTVRITDAHDSTKSPSSLGKDLTVTDGVIRDVIKGVDLKLTLTASGTSFVHIKANPTKAAIGANEGQTLDISIGRVDTVALGIDNVVVATFDDAQKSITKLDKALETLSKSRATAGAQMNRLDYTINNLNVMRENLTSAESRLRDLDMAQASSDLTAQQVRLQAATAMLAQANQMPSYAAQLLQ